MNDRDFIDKIKDITDDTPIPEAIEPASIEQLLKDKKQKRKNPIIKYSAIAASILVIGLSITILKINSNLSIFNSKSDDSNYETSFEAPISDDSTEISQDSDEVILVNSDMTANSYNEIYKIFKDIFKDYQYSYGYDDAVADYETITNESATAAAAEGFAEDSSDSAESTKTSNDLNDSSDFSTTNTQVEGIDEGDIVKTDGKYIYSCDITSYSPVITINITSANQGELTNKGQIIIQDKQGETLSVQEMYISDDKLIVIACQTLYQRKSVFNNQVASKDITITYVYDVSNINSPKFISSLQQDGSYRTSRKSGDYVYVFTQHYIYYFDNSSKKRDYIPWVESQILDYTNIYIPETTQSTSYVVLTSIDLNDAEHFTDKKAVLASADIFYVSNENIYVSEYVYNYRNTDRNNYTSYTSDQTQLLKLSYSKGIFSPEGSIKIKGTLNNQFSLDEYNGYLRVVTTVNNSHQTYRGNDDTYSYDNYITNSLYVINSNLELVGKIENIAKDERIYSARFYGDTGYFVTYRNTDPLFSVDLSDPTNPEIIGALKIPGFSTYMHFYGDGKLLGIGQETDPDSGEILGIKLSMFDISDPSDVKEIDKFVLYDVFWSEALYNHKAILVNPEKNIIGFTTCNYYYDDCYNYNTFSYDDKKGFVNHIEYKLYDPDVNYIYKYGFDYTRGLYIGEYIYVTTPSVGITSYKLGSNECIDNIEFD